MKVKQKTKTINEYAALISSIRKEYEIFYKKNQNLKTENQKLKDYNNRQLDYDRRVIQKLPKIPPQRKRKYRQAAVATAKAQVIITTNIQKRKMKSKKEIKCSMTM